MDLLTEHECLPALFLFPGRKIKVITTQRLPEMPPRPALPISTFHLFHKTFTNIGFFPRESQRGQQRGDVTEGPGGRSEKGVQHQVSNWPGGHWGRT